VDYDSSRVYVYTKGSFKYPKGGHLLRPIIASLPIQYARVTDAEAINARFYFDTGAGLCALLSTDFVQDSSLMDPHKKPISPRPKGWAERPICG